MFKVLKITDESPDFDIVKQITKQGLNFFDKYIDAIKIPNSYDFKFYINYLRLYMTHDNIFLNPNYTISTMKKTEKLLEHLTKYKDRNIIKYLKYFHDPLMLATKEHKRSNIEESFLTIYSYILSYLNNTTNLKKYPSFLSNFCNDVDSSIFSSKM